MLQPYAYKPPVAVEARDWRRLPGFASASERDWLNAAWQLKHAIRDVAGVRRVFGRHADELLLEAISADQRSWATMPLLVPPHVANAMDEHDLWSDPLRRYMLPAAVDRDPVWPSHPRARRDSLYEMDMWTVEGLTHRYPYKVLVDMVASCPQYCGHCTRMDLVGGSTPGFPKHRLSRSASERDRAVLDYIAAQATVRGVVLSGGDIANVGLERLQSFVCRLVEIDHVRDVRLASKALGSLPQHFLRPDVLRALERIALKASSNGVELALHTHINHVNALTETVRLASCAVREAGISQIRNQTVLLRDVNDDPKAMLDLCFGLLDTVGITPYYVYMCDMIPNAEHWRTSLAEAQALQSAIQGYLPGFGTPQVVCDVPRAGKRGVHEACEYDRVMGVSRWRKGFSTVLDQGSEGAFEYYDPMHSLHEDGRARWIELLDRDEAVSAARA